MQEPQYGWGYALANIAVLLLLVIVPALVLLVRYE